MESVNRQLLPNSCSAIGSNGQTGCTQAMLRKWFEERRLAKDEAAGIPSALFRYLPPTIARSRLCIGRIAVIPPVRLRRAAHMLSAMRDVPPRRRCPDGRLSGPVPGSDGTI